VLTATPELRLTCLQCNGKHEHATLEVRDPKTGLHLTALASRYPRRLCQSLAADFVQHLRKTGQLSRRVRPKDAFVAKAHVPQDGCPRCLGDKTVDHTREKGKCRAHGKLPVTPRVSGTSTPGQSRVPVTPLVPVFPPDFPKTPATAAPSSPRPGIPPTPAPKASPVPTTPLDPVPRGKGLGVPGDSKPSSIGKQRTLSSADYKKELDKLKDPSLSIASARTDEVAKYIRDLAVSPVPDTLTWDIKIPCLHEHRTVATAINRSYSLLSAELRDDVADAMASNELVWTCDVVDDIRHWDPPLCPEIAALERIFSPIIVPERIAIRHDPRALPYGYGSIRLTIAKLKPGSKTAWHISLEELEAAQDDEDYHSAACGTHPAREYSRSQLMCLRYLTVDSAMSTAKTKLCTVEHQAFAVDSDTVEGVIVLHGEPSVPRGSRSAVADAPVVDADTARASGVPGSLAKLVRDLMQADQK